MSTDELKKRLKEFVNYQVGKEIRDKIKSDAAKTYRGKYDSELYRALFLDDDFMDGFRVDRVHPMDNNHPYVYLAETRASQPLYGDSVLEIFDQMISIRLNNSGRNKY